MRKKTLWGMLAIAIACVACVSSVSQAKKHAITAGKYGELAMTDLSFTGFSGFCYEDSAYYYGLTSSLDVAFVVIKTSEAQNVEPISKAIGNDSEAKEFALLLLSSVRDDMAVEDLSATVILQQRTQSEYVYAVELAEKKGAIVTGNSLYMEVYPNGVLSILLNYKESATSTKDQVAVDEQNAIELSYESIGQFVQKHFFDAQPVEGSETKPPSGDLPDSGVLPAEDGAQTDYSAFFAASLADRASHVLRVEGLRVMKGELKWRISVEGIYLNPVTTTTFLVEVDAFSGLCSVDMIK